MSACSSQQAVGWFLVGRAATPRMEGPGAEPRGLTSLVYGSSVCCGWGCTPVLGGLWLEPGLN